jgi:hypothetical protein
VLRKAMDLYSATASPMTISAVQSLTDTPLRERRTD